MTKYIIYLIKKHIFYVILIICGYNNTNVSFDLKRIHAYIPLYKMIN